MEGLSEALEKEDLRRIKYHLTSIEDAAVSGLLSLVEGAESKAVKGSPLRPEEVEDIRRRLSQGESWQDLAYEFAVSPSVVFHIKKSLQSTRPDLSPKGGEDNLDEAEPQNYPREEVNS
jgi:DNA invertase Pin-like site-specific DNA recombinase